jgi:hypothetical protein
MKENKVGNSNKENIQVDLKKKDIIINNKDRVDLKEMEDK